MTDSQFLSFCCDSEWLHFYFSYPKGPTGRTPRFLPCLRPCWRRTEMEERGARKIQVCDHRKTACEVSGNNLHIPKAGYGNSLSVFIDTFFCKDSELVDEENLIMMLGIRTRIHIVSLSMISYWNSGIVTTLNASAWTLMSQVKISTSYQFIVCC